MAAAPAPAPAPPPIHAYASEPAAPVRGYAHEPAPEPLRPYGGHESPPAITLSPRLREKLERAQVDESEDDANGPGLRRMILIGVAALVLVGGIVAYRFAVWPPLNNGVDAVLGRAPVTPATTTAPVTNPAAVTPVVPPTSDATPPPAAATTSPSPAPTRPAEPTTPTTATTTPARTTSPAPRPATTARATPAASYGLQVGTFLFEDVATAESAKLATSTGLRGRVEPVRDGSETTFRLVLGRFTSRASAERTASDLIGRGLVDEARVVTVGGATP
jgi:cell division septation protein DedD